MRSGFIFVLASSLVLDALVADNREKGIGVFYGGVGFGIALSGLLISLFSLHSWRGVFALILQAMEVILPVLLPNIFGVTLGQDFVMDTTKSYSVSLALATSVLVIAVM